MILGLGIDFVHAGLVPMGSANHMAGLLQGPHFQIATKGKFFLLQTNIVFTQHIPKGLTVLHTNRHTLRIVTSIDTAQALDADDQMIQHSCLFRSIHHSKGMGIFRAPNMNHIRPKGLQFFREQVLLFLAVIIGQTVGKSSEAEPFVRSTFTTVISGKQYANGNIIALPQIR